MKLSAILIGLVLSGCATTSQMSHDGERTGVYLACLNLTYGLSIGLCNCVEQSIVSTYGPEVTSSTPGAIEIFQKALVTCHEDYVGSMIDSEDKTPNL